MAAEGPYAPSGWKPDGPAFELPSRPNHQVSFRLILVLVVGRYLSLSMLSANSLPLLESLQIFFPETVPVFPYSVHSFPHPATTAANLSKVINAESWHSKT